MASATSTPSASRSGTYSVTPASPRTLFPWWRWRTGRAATRGGSGRTWTRSPRAGRAVRDGRVWLGDRAVDIAARIFLIDPLPHPGAPAVMDPVTDAVARGQ